MHTKLVFVLVLSVFIINTTGQIPSNGLVAYWPFNGNALDESGTHHNGTVHGAQLVPDRFGRALQAYDFTNQDSIIVVDDDALSFPGNTFTFSIWVYLEPEAENDQVILGKRQYNNDSPEYLFVKPAGSEYPQFYFWDQDQSTLVDPNMVTKSMNQEEWESWIVTCDNAILKVYKNGILVSQGIIDNDVQMFNGAGDLSFGFGGDQDGSSYFLGMIDDIRIYNRALDPSEVEAVFNEAPVYFHKSQTFPAVARAWMDWADYDVDGDYDIMLTGAYTARLYKNNGGQLEVVENNIFKRRNPGYTPVNGQPEFLYNLQGVDNSSIEWGDYNNDNALDFIITGAPNASSSAQHIAMIYKNTGPNAYENTHNLDGIDYGDASWGDFNNDGFEDILLSGSMVPPGTTTTARVTKVYQNDKNGGFEEVVSITLPDLKNSSVEWADMDNDGDLDIILCGNAGYHQDYYKLFENQGNSVFAEITGAFADGKNMNVEVGDMNGDGYLDVVKGYANPTVYFNEKEMIFSPVNVDNNNRSGTASLGDFDNDGDLDVLNASVLYSARDSNIFYRIMDLSPTDARYSSFCDVNGDSTLDFFLSGSYNIYDANNRYLRTETTTELYLNTSVARNSAPSTPTNLYTIIDGVDVSFYWDASHDNETSSEGLSYDIYVYEEGRDDFILSPRANLETGFRYLKKRGRIQLSENGYTLKGFYTSGLQYKWSIQAVDGGFLGSAFAEEQEIKQLAAPAEQASGIILMEHTPEWVSIGWSPGNGSGRTVFIKEGDGGQAEPDNGIAYKASIQFGAGDQIGSSGWFCVYRGTGNETRIENLVQGTTYTVMVCEINGGQSATKYNASSASGNPLTFTTAWAAPESQASELQFTGISNTGVTINWMNGDGMGRSIFLTEDISGQAEPVDGIAYDARTSFGQGDQIGSSGWYCVYSGSGQTVEVENLEAGRSYRAMVCEFNGSGSGIVYNTETTASNPGSFQTTSTDIEQGFTGLIKVYPNPVEDILVINIESDFKEHKGYSIKIMGLTGEVLCVNRVSTPVCEIDLKGLVKPGLFFIQLTDQNGQVMYMNKMVFAPR